MMITYYRNVAALVQMILWVMDKEPRRWSDLSAVEQGVMTELVAFVHGNIQQSNAAIWAANLNGLPKAKFILICQTVKTLMVRGDDYYTLSTLDFIGTK